MSKFGENLKKFRSEKGLSQEELATILGTSKQVLSRYEIGQRVPKISVVQNYANKLNLPLNYFLEDSSLKEEKKGYYSDAKVAAYAQEIYENPNLRMLFDASKDVSKEDLEAVVDLMTRLKKRERGE